MQRKVVKKQTTKTVVTPKAVVKAKTKTTMQSSKAMSSSKAMQSGKATTSPRDKVVKALKAKIMANNREEMAEMKAAKKAIKKAPKMAMGCGGMKKYADGTRAIGGGGSKKKSATVKRGANMKELRLTPYGAQLVDSQLSDKARVAKAQTKASSTMIQQKSQRDRYNVDKKIAENLENIEGQERRAVSSAKNRELNEFTMPSSKNGTERTNTTNGNYQTKSGNANGRAFGGTDLSCKKVSQAAKARLVKAKGSSGINIGDDKSKPKTATIKRSANMEVLNIKPQGMGASFDANSLKEAEKAGTSKEIRTYLANKEYQGKQAIKSLKARQSKNQGKSDYGTDKSRIKKYKDAMNFLK